MKNKSSKTVSLLIALAILASTVLVLFLVDIDMTNAVERGKNDAYADIHHSQISASK